MAAPRLTRLVRTVLGRRRAPARRPDAPRPTAPQPPRAVERGPAPGDEIGWRPRPDGAPDPGEVVWAWVPFDEGDGRGKDRPVLVIGRRGEDLLALQLSSVDHDRDAADEARYGRYWTDLGTGPWDPRGRPSEVRLDRLLVLAVPGVRREGAALDRARFERVVEEARRTQGW
ncbi:type II toxin-antitoxin system PemK/MazF family toxin [Geodermatophilus sp. SYSU D00691]